MQQQHGRIEPSGVVVRPATLGDGQGIGETHAEAWLAAYTHAFDPEFLARAAAGRRVGWADSLPYFLEQPGFLLVAEKSGRVVGFSHAGADSGGRRIAEVYGFYTHPDVWGTGAALSLMTETLARLEGEYAEVAVWTLRDAAQARRFYEKAGFVATGAEKIEVLTADWRSGESVERPAVEYLRPLR